MSDKISNLQPELVQIGGSKKPNAPVYSRIASGPVADKFFVIGAIATFFGIGWLGSHMWLTLYGQKHGTMSYATMKQAHITLQMYLFLGSFVLGFINQAGPKLLGVPGVPSPFAYVQLFLLLIGCIVKVAFPAELIGAILISSSFIAACYTVVKIILANSNKINPKSAFLVLFGLFAFAIAPFVETSNALNALCVFWLSLAPLLFVSQEQFVSGFFGGVKGQGAKGFILCGMYLLSALIAIGVYLTSNSLLWNIWGISICILVVYSGWITKFWQRLWAKITEPLGLSFFFGSIWVLGSGVAMSFCSIAKADVVFHALALGWACSILLAVSSQIMGHLSAWPLLRPRFLCAFLVAWQIVPFGRSFSEYLHHAERLAWLITIVATVVIVVWTVQIVRAEKRIVRRQYSLKLNERLPSC